MKKSVLLFALLYFSQALYSQAMAIKGVIEWDRMELSSVISFSLKDAGLKLPAGRSQAEALLEDSYPALVREAILGIQVDSSSTVGDLVNSGELPLREADAFPSEAARIPPSLSTDLSSISARYSLSLYKISSTLIKHRYPREPAAPLIPSAARSYTGIIIIADESLPVHGRNENVFLRPCLFPKIWDSEMNLIYERNTALPDKDIIYYVSKESIFASNPSGLDEKLTARVGSNPLKIMARGVFGRIPTDPVIDKEDALIILSSQANRLLLRDGKVALVLDKKALKVDL
jgi:hypothetical protein